MDQTDLTSTFSICLALDDKTTRAVEDIRRTLPASPYRDDTPHVTLLRSIKTPSVMSDTELLQGIERLVELSKHLPLSATMNKSANRFSPLFRTSSLVLLHPSPEMKQYHKSVIKTLRANNYSVSLERFVFSPHISIRLGVPFTEQARVMVEKSFVLGAELTFNRWMILRDIKKDGKNLVREIALDS